MSYNPGYQTLHKALKPSTRQRFIAIEFGFLPAEQEIARTLGIALLSQPPATLAGAWHTLRETAASV